MKRDSPGQYGELAPREAITIPWQEIHVDLFGVWKIKLNGHELSYVGLTTIDPVTNLEEITRLKSKTSFETARALEKSWLCRYPRPLRCVHDNGPEFNGHDFQCLLIRAGIESKPVTSLNPQSNGIIERSHATVAQVLRVMVHMKPPNNREEADRLIDDSIAQAIHATRCVSHGSLNNVSPGAVTFHRDMLLDLPVVADLLTLQQMSQGQIDKRLLTANQKRKPRDWQIGELILVRQRTGPGDKLRPTYKGPYQIFRVHTNGTVTIRTPNGIHERINIRRLKPYVLPDQQHPP